MGRVYLRLVAVVFFAIAPCTWAVPKICCDNPVWDLGDRPNGGALTHEYRIENQGDEPLLFGKVKSCCGLTVDFPDKELLPGSHAVCKVRFDISRRAGKLNKAIYIASNDPALPYLILNIRGFLQQAMAIEPRYVRFGPTDETVSKTVRLISSDAPFSILDVKCSMKGITVAKRQASETEWVLEVSPSSAFSGGKVSGRIEVQTDHPQHPTVSISLYGSVESAVKISPAEVLVTSGRDPVVRYVAIRSQDSFRILSAELKRCEGVVDQTSLGQAGWRFGLELSPTSVGSDACLEIKTDHPMHPKLTVPIRRVN